MEAVLTVARQDVQFGPLPPDYGDLRISLPYVAHPVRHGEDAAPQRRVIERRLLVVCHLGVIQVLEQHQRQPAGLVYAPLPVLRRSPGW